MRQLAAIMFSDISGYTALVQQNERLAVDMRRRLKDVLDAAVSGHGGKVLQYYGDGALSMFTSAVEGVHCAVAIQQALRQHPKVDVRIGLHAGDIAIEDEAVYGDGVNLASRIETLAVPGSVLVSEKVFDEIRNHEDLAARELGYFEFKNVLKPVRVYAIDNDALVVPARAELKGKTSQPVNRLAVLPFVNMSADPDNEYFSDGISEELLNALTKVDGLQVTSRTSAFAFKGKQTDIRDIGVQLNVDRVLEGSVRKAGSRVRITAQLINAADGYHVWSETFDRDLTDIFQVQDEISAIIANKFREKLTPEEHMEPLVKTPTDNLDAYTFFLKGLHFYNRITPDDMKKAIECFEKAIGLEPEYAQAYAMVAAAHAHLGSTGQMQPHEAFAVVHRYSDKALQLNSSLAAGYSAKGAAYLLYDWKWKQAHESLLKAREINPAATGAHQLLSLFYMITGQRNEAVDIMEDARQVDPLSTHVNKSLADSYLNAGRIDDALNVVDHLLSMHPEMRAALELKGWCIGLGGDWKSAAGIFEKVHALVNHPLKAVTGLGYASAKAGDTERALACIRKIEQRQIEEPGVVLDIDLAMVWWGMGEKDKAFHNLFQCVEKRIGPVAILIEHPIFAGVSDDSRFQMLKQKLNLDTVS